MRYEINIRVIFDTEKNIPEINFFGTGDGLMNFLETLPEIEEAKNVDTEFKLKRVQN